MAEVLELTESKGVDYGDRQILEENTVLEAEIVSVKRREHKYFKDDDGNPQKEFLWTFSILDPGYENEEGERRRDWGTTPTTFTSHENCKMRNWTQQALGVTELPVGFKLRLDDNGVVSDLTGSKCRIVLGVDEWEDKKADPKDDGSYPLVRRNKVKDVMRSRSATATAVSEEPF